VDQVELDDVVPFEAGSAAVYDDRYRPSDSCDILVTSERSKLNEHVRDYPP